MRSNSVKSGVSLALVIASLLGWPVPPAHALRQEGADSEQGRRRLTQVLSVPAGLEEGNVPGSFPGIRRILIIGIPESTQGVRSVLGPLYEKRTEEAAYLTRGMLFPDLVEEQRERIFVLAGKMTVNGRTEMTDLRKFFEPERQPRFDLIFVEKGYLADNGVYLMDSLQGTASKGAILVPIDQAKVYSLEDLRRSIFKAISSASGLKEVVVAEVRAKYGSAPFAVGVRQGGTNIAVALVNRQGEVEQRTAPPETRWRDLPSVRALLDNPADDQVDARIQELIPRPGHSLTPQQRQTGHLIADRITLEVVQHIAQAIRNAGLPLQNFRFVHIAFPGPVDSQTGRVGVPYAASNVPGFENYPLVEMVRRGLHEQLGVDVQVQVHNDSPSARIGEQSPGGTAAGLTGVVTMIWGTGMNADSDILQMFEVGHALVGRQEADGWHYELRDASRGRLQLAAGEVELEDRMRGGILEQRFREAGFQGGSDVTQRARAENPNDQERNRARQLIQDAGAEMGRAIAALLAPYHQQSGFVPQQFVMISGVSENLGRGIQSDQGEDLLIGAIQGAAYRELADRFRVPAPAAERMADSIVRSTMDSRREFAAAAQGLPTAGLEEWRDLSSIDALSKLKVDDLLRSPAGKEFLVRYLDQSDAGTWVTVRAVVGGEIQRSSILLEGSEMIHTPGWQYRASAGLEEGSRLQRLLILGDDAQAVEGVRQVVHSLRPELEIRTAALPSDRAQVSAALDRRQRWPHAVIVAGTASSLGTADQPTEVGMMVRLLERFRRPIRFVAFSEGSEATAHEILAELDEFLSTAGLEENALGQVRQGGLALIGAARERGVALAIYPNQFGGKPLSLAEAEAFLQGDSSRFMLEYTDGISFIIRGRDVSIDSDARLEYQTGLLQERLARLAPEELTVPQALGELNALRELVQKKPDAVVNSVRPILVDMSQDPRVGRVAQGLALVLAKYLDGDLEFRVVATAEQKAALVAELERINGLAAGLLEIRVDPTRGEALAKLAPRAGFTGPDGAAQFEKSGSLLEIIRWTEDAAVLLQQILGHLDSYGLSFVSERALQAFRSLLRAA